MAQSFSKYQYDDLDKLNIQIEKAKFNFEGMTPLTPSDWLNVTLDRNMNLPLASEKAKCEFIIAPILTEMVERNNRSFTYFSGYNFNVEKDLGLKGRCDFLLTQAPKSPRIESPVLSVVEAKNDNLDEGIPQCIAQLFALRLFNERKNKPTPIVYGAVTFGLEWQFLKLQEQTAYIDTNIFYIKELPNILGALQWVIDFYNPKQHP
jgi:hypothetical protein